MTRRSEIPYDEHPVTLERAAHDEPLAQVLLDRAREQGVRVDLRSLAGVEREGFQGRGTGLPGVLDRGRQQSRQEPEPRADSRTTKQVTTQRPARSSSSARASASHGESASRAISDSGATDTQPTGSSPSTATSPGVRPPVTSARRSARFWATERASQSSRGCRNTWHQHACGSPGVAITFSSTGHRSAVAGTTSTLMPRIMARRDRSVEQPG